MNVATILIGLMVLVLIAGAIGLANREAVGRERAWREIAAERRRNWEERRRLHEVREAIDHCRHCPERLGAVDPFG
jgi:hypothetical protein